jgi:VWFA-related protein
MLLSIEAVMSTLRPSACVVRRRLGTAISLLALVALAIAPMSRAQTQPTAPPADQSTPEAVPDSGGPSGDSGVIALPKKKDTPSITPPASAVPKIKTPEGTPAFSLHVEVPEVTVDVGVQIEKTGQFVSGLKPENFRVYEDGVEQKIISSKRIEAPITALLVCEFAANSYSFINDMRNSASTFVSQLRPQDYVALMTFDMRTRIVSDFTQDKRQLLEGIDSLRLPSFRDTNLFDALYEAEDRMSRIEGPKYIILIASGRDTFSKLTYDKVLKKVKATPGVTIFAVSTGGGMRVMTEARGRGMGAQMREMDYLQADNQMKSFASSTGGQWFDFRFEGELPDIFKQINQNIRAKYQLVYHPTNTKQDGKFRKVHVELVDAEGRPLQIADEKHKPLKYDIIAREGYNAKQVVE